MLGSPFAVEIANPAVVSAYGAGLETGLRGQKASFIIDTGQPTSIEDIGACVSRKSCCLLYLYPVMLGLKPGFHYPS